MIADVISESSIEDKTAHYTQIQLELGLFTYKLVRQRFIPYVWLIHARNFLCESQIAMDKSLNDHIEELIKYIVFDQEVQNVQLCSRKHA